MRYVVSTLSLLLISSPAFAQVAPTAPAPEADFGIAAFAMVAGAALLARRRRRG